MLSFVVVLSQTPTTFSARSFFARYGFSVFCNLLWVFVSLTQPVFCVTHIYF